MKSARSKAVSLHFVFAISVGVGCYVWGGFAALADYLLGYFLVWATVSSARMAYEL